MSTWRLLSLLGETTNGTATITGPATAEPFETLTFQCNAVGPVTSFTWSTFTGPTLTYTRPVVDNLATGVSVVNVEAPAVFAGTTNTVRCVVVSASGTLTADFTLTTGPVLFLRLASGTWTPLPMFRITT